MSLRLNGSNSGFSEITAPATAGDNTLTLPAGNGSANQFLKNSGTAGALEFSSSATDGSGRLLINTSSTIPSPGIFNPALQVVHVSANADTCGISLSKFQAGNPSASPFIFQKSRNDTIGSHTIVADDDVLGVVQFTGSDGSTFVPAAAIEGEVDGTPGGTDMPGRLVFSTTADGASTPTERMRITSTGSVLAQGVYDGTTSTGANVVVEPDGTIRRSTSSIKYKTDVETLEDSYADALLNCRPVWYRSLSPTDNPEHGWWGFIAEEVAKIDPRLVHWKTKKTTYDESGSAVVESCDPEPEGVMYDRFVPHLLNLIKRQQQVIKTLETQNTAQQTQIDDLLARVTALEAA